MAAAILLFTKEFADKRKEVVEQLRELVQTNKVGTTEHQSLTQALCYINRMRDYIATGDWARKASKAKYIFWIKSDYNYSLTARQFGTTVECLRVFVSRHDEVLKRLMSKPLELILQGKVEDGWIEFCINTNQLDINELFGVAVNVRMPNPSLVNCYTLADCKDEIKFLRIHNSFDVANQLKSLNQSKLAYLLGVASSNDAEYKDERCKLIKSIIKFDTKTN